MLIKQKFVFPLRFSAFVLNVEIKEVKLIKEKLVE